MGVIRFGSCQAWMERLIENQALRLCYCTFQVFGEQLPEVH